MKYKVSGPLPIATNKGDVEPGKTVDSADMDERTNFDALVAAGHLEPVKQAGGGGGQGSSQ